MQFNRLAPIGFAVLLAGCGSIGAIGLPPMNNSQPPPQEMGGLPPGTAVAGAPPGDVTSEPLPDAGVSTDVAVAPAAAPAATGSNVSRTDLLGGWTIASSGDSCQLFMTLTSWTGGYRASTRGCNSDALKQISAWNLEGKQVVLAGTGGSPLARLSSSGSGRFDGQTLTGGAPVSFFR